LAGAARSESATRQLATGSPVAAGVPSPCQADVTAQPTSRQSAPPAGFHEPPGRTWNSGWNVALSKCVTSLLTVETAAWNWPAKCSRSAPR
jgi:hypothetical protein